VIRSRRRDRVSRCQRCGGRSRGHDQFLGAPARPPPGFFYSKESTGVLGLLQTGGCVVAHGSRPSAFLERGRLVVMASQLRGVAARRLSGFAGRSGLLPFILSRALGAVRSSLYGDKASKTFVVFPLFLATAPQLLPTQSSRSPSPQSQAAKMLWRCGSCLQPPFCRAEITSFDFSTSNALVLQQIQWSNILLH
jgi:hypothetical protein